MPTLDAWVVDRGLSGLTCLAFNPSITSEFVATGAAPVDTHVPLDTYAVTSNLPVTTTPRTLTASKVGSWFDDYYHRVHISPSKVDLGNTFGTQTRPVDVWNANLNPITLSSISGTGVDGMSVTSPSAVPFVFPTLRERRFTLNVSLDGPTIINGEFQFNFGDESVDLGITGRRVVTWPYPPNWKTPMSEIVAWKTEVLRAFDGSETRRELRTRPRRAFSYNLTLHGREPARLDNLLWGWQNRNFALPVWMDKSPLLATVSSGATGLTVNTLDRSFVAGGLAILYADNRHYEIVEIDTLTGSTITLRRPVEATWVAGVSVYPCVIAHLPRQVTVRRMTDSVVSATVDFTCEPSSTDPYLPTASAEMTYQGVEVISRQPNWAGSIDNQFDYAFETLDTDVGTILWYDTEAFPRISRNYNWLIKGREAIRKMREMLARRRGQMKPVYVPTWHADMTMLEAVTPLSVSIKVVANEFAEMVGVDPARQHLLIRLKSGQWLIRQVLGATTSGDETTVVLSSEVGVAFGPTDVQAIHMLMLSRLSGDQITLQWHTDDVVVVNTPFITVKE